MFQDITGEYEREGGRRERGCYVQGKHSADIRVSNLRKGHTRSSLRGWRVTIVIREPLPEYYIIIQGIIAAPLYVLLNKMRKTSAHRDM